MYSSSQRNKKYNVYESDLSEYIDRNIRPKGGALLLCRKGYAIASVNLERKTVYSGDIIIIFPDTMFVVEQISRDFSVLFIDISMTLCDETTFSLQPDFLNYIYDEPIFHIEKQYAHFIDLWVKQIGWIAEYTSERARHIIMRNQLQSLFIAIEALYPYKTTSSVKPISSTRQLFNNFCRLLCEYCYAQHNVKFYAEKLCITPYYLSRITFKVSKMSPKEMIDSQIIMEIKHILISTDLSVKEIADKFHFETASYLSRYFRRHTGFTPAKYRELN